MQLEIITFCDAATEYGGRLNILGATDSLAAIELPVRHPHSSIVVRLRAARIESGEHTVKLMIINLDSQPILNIDGKMNVQFASGSGGAVNLIINAVNLEFKEFGEYAIEVAVDGIQVGSSPLFVRKITNSVGQ